MYKRELKKMEIIFFVAMEIHSHIISQARIRHYMNILKTKINTARKSVSVIINQKTKTPPIKVRLEANTPIGMADTVKMRRQKFRITTPGVEIAETTVSYTMLN